MWGAFERDRQPRTSLRLLHRAARAGQPDLEVQHPDGPARSEYDAVLQIEEERIPAARVADLLAHAADGAAGRRRNFRRTGTDGRSDPADGGRSHQQHGHERSVESLSDDAGY